MKTNRIDKSAKKGSLVSPCKNTGYSDTGTNMFYHYFTDVKSGRVEIVDILTGEVVFRGAF